MRKEIIDLQERHKTTVLNSSKNFFSNNHIMDIFMFISSIISLISTNLILYLLCKHKKIRTLIASLVLNQVKKVGTTSRETNSKYTALAYIGIILTILSLIIVTFLHQDFVRSQIYLLNNFTNFNNLNYIFTVQT